MQILFDLQKELETLEKGKLKGTEYVMPVGETLPELCVEIVDDVKTILVKSREDITAGLGIHLGEVPEIRVGDRIAVTGRVTHESPAATWGVALVTSNNKTLVAQEERQLDMYTSPRPLYSLSHILCEDDLNSLLIVQTTYWGSLNPIMDFYIDSIFIFRDEKYVDVIEDTRSMVYSLSADKHLEPGSEIAIVDTRVPHTLLIPDTIVKSGEPKVKFYKLGESLAIHVTSRAMSHDGIDINLHALELISGNKYQVIVTGAMEGVSPEGTVITLQGIPGYSWRNNQHIISPDQLFTLRYTLTAADVDQWLTIRITTNSTGATVPFYIYSIEIKRLGLL